MSDLDTREWLLTNGLGSFASGTVSDIRTRIYHGWLFAAKNPPYERTLLLSHLEASLEVSGSVIGLGANIWGNVQIERGGYELLRFFDINPVPKWIWGQDNWQLTRQLVMPYGWEESREQGSREHGRIYSDQRPMPNAPVQFCDRILIQYRYEGSEQAILRLRLLIAERDFHHQQTFDSELQFSQLLGQQQVCLQARKSQHFGIPWHLRWTKGNYQSDAVWYWNYRFSEETKRGLADKEDLHSPGYLTVTLQPGDAVTLEARLGFPNPLLGVLTSETFAEAVEAEQERLSQIFGWSGTGGMEDGEMGGWGDGETRETRETREQGSRGDEFFLSAPCPMTPLAPLGETPRPQWLPNAQCPMPNAQCPMPNAPIIQQLLKASDRFIVYRASTASPTVIAGYHWFNDWARDTLIALPGLTLVPQRFELAKEILRSFGHYCRHGLIPNAFPDVDREPFYNSIDTPLWWIETLGLYLEATQDWQFLAEQFSVVQQIHKAFIGGTRYNIQADATDGLIGWDARGVALTWMDVVIGANPVTPRRGKPVEINALWYSALCWLSQWAERLSQLEFREPVRLSKQAKRYAQQAQLVKNSLQKFWNPQLGYLYDTIEPDDRRNFQIRPNAVLALSLHHCGFSEHQGCQILDLATTSLLTPYGLRSLDPGDPEYKGKYEGNQEQRDRAYHQGTVWPWLIGPYIRAWQRFYPQQALPFDWQPLIDHFLFAACIGSISEIFDGDSPHTPRGAIAQAWSVAEVIRHIQ
ncbi:amylo-alpha-1,6-glucosidase [Nostoc linckia z4]|uniref:amylo-alpha-1,6-glucosidase n=8 Tax=Nostoc linckia TaxID=92942 RepID=UPI000BFFAC4B|nr:amylo-alpha-1,6-glucosidase [Nostoc linckia]PHK45308.1 amylo-alpha-1,6-glucosidase [Nostoc linckia z16]PHJ60798.1 amylo-alpha-1,6-glucosidase [Nostoc linckia z1]PHJ68103.1 amylo-alpha-1,6-glucosidase [Nostoc linckia z2]PHJ71728.1 amylo-alpha-1,6-glucosidase [Nostoc linckia z3]PHJ85411.1 amylo-alpha-1,6-glucosidase [Nostoc linckia z6]